MGCGASSDREAVYRQDGDSALLNMKEGTFNTVSWDGGKSAAGAGGGAGGGGGGDAGGGTAGGGGAGGLLTPGGDHPGLAGSISVNPPSTVTFICNGVLRGLKYSELTETTLAADPGEGGGPNNLGKLWELLRGKRTLVKGQPTGESKLVRIYTDLGVHGLLVDRQQALKLEDVGQQPAEVLKMVTAQTKSARCTGVLQRYVRGHAKPIKSLAISLSDQLLVTTDTALGPSEARVLDVNLDWPCGQLDGRRRDCLDSAFDSSFSVDGTLLATVHRMEKLFLWDMSTFRVKKTTTFTEDNGEIRMSAVRFSPNAKLIAVASEAAYEDQDTIGMLLIYDNKCELVSRYSYEDKVISSLAFSNDSSNVLLGLQDGRVCELSAKSGEVSHVVPAHASAVRCVYYTAPGDRFMTADEREVSMWDRATWTKLWCREVDNAEAIVYGPAPPPVVVDDSESDISSVSAVSPPDGSPSGSPVPSPPQMPQADTSPTLMPRARVARHMFACCAPGSLVAVARSDKTVQFLDDADGSVHSEIQHKGVVMRMAAGSKTVAMGDVFGNVSIVELLEN